MTSDMTRDQRVYVRRRGRLTSGQARALAEHGDRYRLGNPADCRPPVFLEVGFGMGHALADFAAAHPAWTCVGVDVYQPGIGSLVLQCEARALGNVRFVEDDVRAVLSAWPDGGIRLVAVYFPDPWPKARHHKRRLVQPPFAAELARVLEPGGRVLLATDWASYAEQMLAVLDAEPALVNAAGTGAFAPRPEERPMTRFEARGRALGHDIRDLVYVRREEDAGIREPTD